MKVAETDLSTAETSIFCNHGDTEGTEGIDPSEATRSARCLRMIRDESGDPNHCPKGNGGNGEGFSNPSRFTEGRKGRRAGANRSDRFYRR
jgi:hypothetical protein